MGWCKAEFFVEFGVLVDFSYLVCGFCFVGLDLIVLLGVCDCFDFAFCV